MEVFKGDNHDEVDNIDSALNEEDNIPNETISLLETISENSKAVIESARNVLLRLHDGNLATHKGISFLEIKNEMLLSYLIDLTYLISLKVCGHELEGNEVVKRLAEDRTVLEKIRPIDHKLKYQIEKLIAGPSASSQEDPLRYKPKLGNLVGGEGIGNEGEDGEMEGHDDEDNEKESIQDKAKLYVPPKVASMKYEEHDEKKVKALEKARKKAMSSSIIEELKREFDDRPEEIEEESNYGHRKYQKQMKQRIDYEEEHMTRVNVPKKQRNESKRMLTMSSLATGITRFEDISALDVDNPDEFEFPKKRGKKEGSAKKSFKKKKFSKRR